MSLRKKNVNLKALRLIKFIVSSNVLLPTRDQAITWTDLFFLSSISTLKTYFSNILVQIYIWFNHGNAFENVICKVLIILFRVQLCLNALTHWGRVTHICVSKLTIIGSDNGLSLGRRQAIIWTNAGILLIGPLRTNFCVILIKIHTFTFKKMHLNISSGKRRPFCLGLNVLMQSWHLNERNWHLGMQKFQNW